jgi:WD40 repeat protein
VYLFDLASGRMLQELAGHRGFVDALDFSPDGALLASAGDGNLKLWDAASGRVRAKIACAGPEPDSPGAILRDVQFTPDGRRVAVFGAFKPGAGVSQPYPPLVRIWDVAGGALRADIPGHGDLVLCGAFSADGAELVTASSDRSLRAWDVATGTELRRIESTSKLYGADFSADRATVAFGEGPLTALCSGAFERLAALGDPAAAALHVSELAFSPDGKLLATNGAGDTIDLWDLAAR